MTSFPFLIHRRFWLTFLISFIFFGFFFAWEFGMFKDFFFALPRPEPTRNELMFTFVLLFLLALNFGLFSYQKKYGSCPLGTRCASSIAGAISAVALLCPVCLLIPISFIGVSISLFFLVPYLPLLRFIALILLLASTWLLWPRVRK